MTQRGICKLCLTDKELLNSHYIPRSLYMRDAFYVTARKVLRSDRQMTAYELCADCEDRFNKNGESYVLRWLTPNQPTSRILRTLNLAIPVPGSGSRDFLVYSATAIGLDTRKFAYFVMSVLWRGSIRRWRTPDGSDTEVLPLGSYSELIRRYLMGEAPLPETIVITLAVCSDNASRGSILPPSPPRADNPHPFIEFQTRGMRFGSMFDVDPKDPFQQLACDRNPQFGISLRSCVDKASKEFDTLRRTAIPVGRAKLRSSDSGN